jgi:DNA-binding CsgD family transcriptional regulator
VVRLAAEGRTNREVAHALFITAKTVKDHLGSAYGKLQITSRGELARALAGGD